MIKAVAFDLDGVLIDSEPMYKIMKSRHLEKYDLHISKEEAMMFAGEKFRDTIRRIFPDMTDDLRKEITDSFNISAIIDLPFEDIFDSCAEELLISLKRDKYKVAIASSSPMEKIEIFIDRCKVGKYFDLIASGEMFTRTKPDPAIYKYVAEQFSLAPAECAAVEDSDHGLLAARGAGYRVICKRDDRFNYKQEEADHWVDSLIEIEDILRLDATGNMNL
ncbi:MAG: HAD family phosphatase [Synergistaceae bacterium]|jgi:beta-phosphoglucomutase-like phosphatase (HAD superfamily)|nr:HAD family phosphatase [Synergistaceae bacterium]